MANKKRRSGNKKPRSASQNKTAPQGGQKPPQNSPQGGQKPPQRSSEDASSSANRRGNQASGPPKTRPDQNKPGQNKPGQNKPGQNKPGQRKPAGSARRAAQRRAAKRKRQMLTVGVPIAVVVLLVVLLIAINGGPQGKGKVSSASDVKISGGPRTEVVPDGEKLPTFSAPGLDGGTISSVDGQPSVVAIWASWCHVCQEELPILNTVKEGYPGVKTISITTSQGQEPGPTAEQFVADKKITIPVAVDNASGDLRQGMGVTSFPVLYFVNADGSVYKSNIGLLDEGQLITYYDALQQPAGQASPTPKPAK